MKVALHPEGVDRNGFRFQILPRFRWSPSTRRAWIEIRKHQYKRLRRVVALHPEGVDRNRSARQRCHDLQDVALHPEGVDRNCVA